MRFCFVAITSLFTFSLAFAETDCSTNLTRPFDVLVVRAVTRNDLVFGDLVAIRHFDRHQRDAFYIGATKDRAYFTSVEPVGIKRPVFYLPIQDVNFLTQTIVAPGTSVRKSLTVTPLPMVDVSSEPDVCAPQSVMACLTHLDQMGLLSGMVKSEINSNRERLFDEMIRMFSRKAIAATDEGRAMIVELENAPDRESSRRLIEKMREFAFSRITLALTRFGVASEVTSSYGKLVRHLRAGKPAYISIGGGAIGVARPHLNDWNSALHWDHSDVGNGTVPLPGWAPNFAGFHGVYALGALPRAVGLSGILRGSRIVILDPEDGELNIWDTLLLRFAGQARFILIEPKS